MKKILCFVALSALALVSSLGDDSSLQALQAKAAQGDATAEYELGRAYHLGQGVPKDFVKAANFYRQAAAQGDAKSMHNLGYIYLHGQGVPKDLASAAQWYRKAADKGLAASQLQLGLSYYFGDMGFKQDYVAAAQWLTLAAQQDNYPSQSAQAANALGSIYEHGLGTPVDGKQAVRWFGKAAEIGNARAQSNLGRIYQEGHLVKRDPVQAYMWLKVASDRRDVSATHLLPEYRVLNEFTAAQMAEGERLAKDYEAKHSRSTASNPAGQNVSGP